MKKALIPLQLVKDFSVKDLDNTINKFGGESCVFYFMDTYQIKPLGLDALSLLHSNDVFFDNPKIKTLNQITEIVSRLNEGGKYRNHKFKIMSVDANHSNCIEDAKQKLNIDFVLSAQ